MQFLSLSPSPSCKLTLIYICSTKNMVVRCWHQTGAAKKRTQYTGRERIKPYVMAESLKKALFKRRDYTILAFVEAQTRHIRFSVSISSYYNYFVWFCWCSLHHSLEFGGWIYGFLMLMQVAECAIASFPHSEVTSCVFYLFFTVLKEPGMSLTCRQQHKQCRKKEEIKWNEK